MPANRDAAEAFHALHRDGILVLANAWDAGSARLIESLGARAIATTSCGVAWSHGYPDGDVLPVEQLVQTIESIARVVGVPLTADVEGGYSDEPSAVGRTVARVVEAGAVGINIEDGAGSPDLLCRKIEACMEAAGRLGVRLFVNARTDVYLRGLAGEGERVDEILRRGKLYRDAGASGLFAPGVVAVDEISALVEGCGLPLNVMARPGLPDAKGLASLGVRRLSAGGDLAEALYARLAALAGDFLADGASEPLAEEAMAYADLNRLMQVAQA